MPRIVIAVLWIALVAWAALGAPAGDGLDGERAMAWMQLDGDPSLVALFNLMGVWPLVLSALLLSDRQRTPAWPFCLASFALGFFALGPYLVLRRWGQPLPELPRWRRWAGHRAVGAVCLLATVGLGMWGLARGSMAAFGEAFAVSTLVNVMSFDFLALAVGGALLVAEDARRRGWPHAGWLGALPLLGPALWLLIRPASERGA